MSEPQPDAKATYRDTSGRFRTWQCWCRSVGGTSLMTYRHSAECQRTEQEKRALS